MPQGFSCKARLQQPLVEVAGFTLSNPNLRDCVADHTLIASRHASIPPKTNPSDWETRASSRTTRGGHEWMTSAG